MNDELKIPKDLRLLYDMVQAETGSTLVPSTKEGVKALIERIAKLEALVREYRSDHAENLDCNRWDDENDRRCDSCRRADELKR